MRIEGLFLRSRIGRRIFWTLLTAAAGSADDTARVADDLVEDLRPHDGSTSGLDPPPRVDEAPAPRAEEPPASSHVDQPSLPQAEGELRFIRDNPELVRGTPPNRTARMGDHTWKETPGGGWCRHSGDPLCVLPSTAQENLGPVAAKADLAPARGPNVTEAQATGEPGLRLGRHRVVSPPVGTARCRARSR